MMFCEASGVQGLCGNMVGGTICYSINYISLVVPLQPFDSFSVPYKIHLIIQA